MRLPAALPGSFSSRQLRARHFNGPSTDVVGTSEGIRTDTVGPSFGVLRSSGGITGSRSARTDSDCEGSWWRPGRVAGGDHAFECQRHRRRPAECVGGSAQTTRKSPAAALMDPQNQPLWGAHTGEHCGQQDQRRREEDSHPRVGNADQRERDHRNGRDQYAAPRCDKSDHIFQVSASTPRDTESASRALSEGTTCICRMGSGAMPWAPRRRRRRPGHRPSRSRQRRCHRHDDAAR